MAPPRLRRLLTAAVAGGGVGAAAVVWAAARSRKPIPGLERFDPPPGLPPARVELVPGHGELFFRDAPGPSPDAPTAVLLHGWTVTADLNWFTAYEPLAAHVRVLAPDHRGHGRAPRPSAPFRLADAADDVAALIRREVGGPAVVVGYSMGGPLAQMVWRRHPDVVRGLVLCATSASFRSSRLQQATWWSIGGLQVLLRLMPRSTFERLLLAQVRGQLPVRVVSQSLSPESAALIPYVPWVVGELERAEPEDIAEAGRELGRFDSTGWIGEVDVPTAVVVTARDRLVPPASQLDLASRIPGAHVLEVGADHDAPASRAQEFTEALVKAVRLVAGDQVWEFGDQ